MTVLPHVRPTFTSRPQGRHFLRGAPVGVLLAALGVVVLRLEFVGSWLSRDEAGFLAVGQQWHAGGSSLYGDLWVDRPPLLVTLFRAAALLGGTVPLRLIGIAAAVVAVLAVGRAAGTLAGPRAATGAALAGAAFLVSPRTGSTEVNGELLAAPFVAVGIAAAIGSLTTGTSRRSLAASGLAGACAVAAVLVKQNMLDVLVFSGVLGLVTVHGLGWLRLRRVLAGFLGGALATSATLAVWTLAHGTSLAGVWFAMYPFRAQADLGKATHPSPGAVLREQHLLLAAAMSGMLLVVALLVVAVLRRRHDHPAGTRTSYVARAVPVALVATVSYDAVSIHLGGSFWTHYLVQLAVPLALAAGLTVRRRPRVGLLVIGLVVVSAVLGSVHRGDDARPAGGNALGAAIRAVAHPKDTIVSVWGRADLTHATGLATPYPYLWFLPERTLDPHALVLASTLGGPRAPTWFVSSSGGEPRGVDTDALLAVIARDYHPVDHLPGTVIYLRDGVHRAAPVLPARAGSTRS